jgi:hypothetical protein
MSASWPVRRREQVEHRRTQILQEVPAIGNLYGIGRALTRTFGIHAAPITANNLHARMRLQPLRNTLSRTLWQEINGLATFQIDHNRRITLAFAFGSIINADLGCRRRSRDRCLANFSKQRISPGRMRNRVSQTFTSSTAECQANPLLCGCQAIRPTHARGKHLRQTFCEDGAWALREIAKELVNPKSELDKHTSWCSR